MEGVQLYMGRWMKIVYAGYDIIRVLSQAFRDLENWASKPAHYTTSINTVSEGYVFVSLSIKKKL